MGDFLQKFVIAGLFSSFLVAIFLLPIAEFNTKYDSNLDTGNLSSINKLNELRAESGEFSDQVTEGSEVTTTESEVDFASNAFTASKFIITGGPLNIISDMFNVIAGIAGLPVIIWTFLAGVIIILLAFTIINKVL